MTTTKTKLKTKLIMTTEVAARSRAKEKMTTKLIMTTNADAARSRAKEKMPNYAQYLGIVTHTVTGQVRIFWDDTWNGICESVYQAIGGSAAVRWAWAGARSGAVPAHHGHHYTGTGTFFNAELRSLTELDDTERGLWAPGSRSRETGMLVFAPPPPPRPPNYGRFGFKRIR